jgi:hypothetical protein
MNLWKPIAVISALAFAGVVASAAGCHATVETVSPGPAPAPGCNNQPNMANALSSLQAARTSLANAEHNKGGWRDRAIGATDNAIRETRTGCNFADTH